MNDANVKYPEVRDLANEAYKASGCSSADEFSRFLGGVGLRTVWRWLRGEGPLGGMAEMVLREVRGGWKPSGWKASGWKA